VGDQQVGEARADHGPRRAADRDDAEEPTPAPEPQSVRHEAPEEGEAEQVEHAHPDVEDAAEPWLAGRREAQGQEEPDQVDGEEPVHDRQEGLAVAAAAEPAERWRERQHRSEREEVQVRQVLHAARDAHLVADRLEDEVRGHQAEEHRGGEQGGDAFARLQSGQFAQVVPRQEPSFVRVPGDGRGLRSAREPVARRRAAPAVDISRQRD